MGLLSFAFLPDHPGYIELGWRMALCGFGFGIFQSPNNRAMLSAAPKERSGGASGMLGTARLLGQTTGAALAALLFARLPHQAPIVGLLISSGFALVAAVVSLARLYEGPMLAQQRTSDPEADPSLHGSLLRADGLQTEDKTSK
jgi:DHA2 family multidrug resistance protein-like MFS transporter